MGTDASGRGIGMMEAEATVGRGGAAASIGRLAWSAFDRIFPPVCVACGVGLGAGAAPLCDLCAGRLPRVCPPRCPRCGATSPGARDVPICPECASWPTSLPHAASPFRMEGAAAEVVHALKYRGWTALAPRLGATLVGPARAITGGRRAVLVPVPVAAARRRERGFDQADLLARALGERCGWPVASILVRARSGRQQARLGRRARAENVHGSFRADRAAAHGVLATAHEESDPVLLVDDVITTGATIGACADALAAAGIACAGAVSFARTLPAFPLPLSAPVRSDSV